MSLFGGMFDLNGNGETDELELFAELQMTGSSRKEAIELTRDDTFYMDSDDEEDEE